MANLYVKKKKKLRGKYFSINNIDLGDWLLRKRR